MTDKELLEMASKAASYNAQQAISAVYPYPTVFYVGQRLWNPLTDDGDALRLAVDLCLAVRLLEKCVFVESNPDTLLSFSAVSEMEMYAGDPYAATRRAIVRVAAEIGKETP